MRAKVEIDTTKPLHTGCWVHRKDLPKIWVIYKYERLQDLCFKCGVLGHEQRACEVPTVMSTYCFSIPKYSQHLSTQPSKPIKTIFYEHKKRYDTTTNTTRKFFKKKETAASSSQPQQGSGSSSVAANASKEREKAKKEWEEMLANCGEFIANFVMGKRQEPLYIRNSSPEHSLSHVYSARSENNSDSCSEEDFPMPKEIFMSDKELDDDRKAEHSEIGSGSQHSTTNANQDNPTYTQLVNSRSQQSSNEGDDLKRQEPEINALMWRDPPKALPKPTPKYVVDFPSDDTSPTEPDHSLRSEEEDALALTLVSSMTIRRKRYADDDDSSQ